MAAAHSIFSVKPAGY